MEQNEFIEKVNTIELKSKNIVRELISKPIVLLPAGYFSKLSIMYLKMWDIEVDYVADNSPNDSRWGRKIWKYSGRDYSVESVADILNTYGDKVNYIITSRPNRRAIQKQLVDGGVDEKSIFYMPARLGDLVPKNSFMRRCVIENDFDRIKYASEQLEDDDSRNQFWELLSIFYANAPVWIEKPSSEEYFQTPYLKFEDDEVFVDAGMFDGNTSLRFTEVCPNFKAIYGIEANPFNLETIYKNLSGIDNVTILNNALCNTDIMLGFSQEGKGPEGARIVDGGEISVKGLRGDDLDIQPTFIKFDIEGAEYDALLGFRKTIEKYKPNMAISVYHSLEDHWRIILLVKEICPDYKLYLEHHYGYEDLYGTILYATVE